MHRFPVPSKEITQVGYQEDSETLEIQFVQGGVYQFFNVPSTVFDEFMSAPPKRDTITRKLASVSPALASRDGHLVLLDVL
jgi:hypothetical protein